ncbi:MAG: DNA translocase FtsK 4TM domain-containing protein [Lepagella sp.]
MSYDNYSPEINYNEEEQKEEVATQPTPKKTSSRTSRKPKNSTKSTSAKAETPKSEKKNFDGTISRFIAWFRSPSAKILAGIFLGCLTVYLALSFCGYFSSCIKDQSIIADSPVGLAKGVSNTGGEGGARLSEMLINRGFGLGSFVIIFWLAALTLKVMIGKPKFRLLDFTIKCIVALITVSLIIGLVTYSLHTPVNWGGYHGTYVNEFIINFIGMSGAVLLSFFMVALFVVICLNDVIRWILRVRRKRIERRRAEAERRAAIAAQEEEIRRMQEQERIDDLKAGETAELTAADNIDTNDDLHLNFENENNGIYDITQVSDDPSLGEYNIDDTSENISAGNRPVGGNNPDSIEEIGNEPENAEIIDETGENSDEKGNNPSKMVVNVNSIDKGNARRYHSDVEIYEGQKYKFPPFDLLREGSNRVSIDNEEQIENKHKIEKTLLDFGIPIIKIEATVGPTVTLYEIVPDTGVKIAKIRSLVDDIALSLSAIGVRIIAPIPGKGTVGIEVANKDKQTVSMRTVIQSKKYQESRYNLPIALGSTISNDVYIADLAKMPHLLVAGATGQGKSVGLNAIIASLLYCKAPHEIKFVLIDPKQVEFSLYNQLKNYYLACIPGEEDEPVITDMGKVEATLNSLCIEMEQRYTLLKNAQTRNIEEYNNKIREGKLNPTEGHRFLPYIVVVVDEFGDLIMVSGKNVEMPIARLAQKARAVGIHVILATQRPSTNVITGIIKANFPARISFKVTAGVDSKTILDTTGAQHLIGKGDMLIFNNSELVRVQCAFIDTPEVEKICEYVSRQPYPQGVYQLPEPLIDSGDGGSGPVSAGSIGEKDPLLVEVARQVVNSGKASTSAVQRTFEIGFNRAGRIMDQLEALGVVGAAQGGKPRAVLVDPMGLEDILCNL